MRESELRAILARIPGVANPGSSGTSNHLKISCVLAQWRHRHGTDRHPSMTVSFDETPSRVYCFGCGYSASLADALFELNIRRGGLAELAVLAQTRDKPTLSNFENLRTPQTLLSHRSPDSDYTPYIQHLLTNEWPSTVYEFLASKNVHPDAARKYFCAYAPAGHWDDGMPIDDEEQPKPLRHDSLVLPIMSHDSEDPSALRCVGAQTRTLDPRGFPKYFTPYSVATRYHLFGQQILPLARGRPICVVEGPFDVMHLVQLGLLAVGLNGVSLSTEKILKIKHASPSLVVLMLDPDTAGRQGVQRAVTRLLQQSVPHRTVTLDRDPKHYSLDELVRTAPFLQPQPSL